MTDRSKPYQQSKIDPKRYAINTIKQADLELCTLKQLSTIIELFMLLDIPVKEDAYKALDNPPEKEII